MNTDELKSAPLFFLLHLINMGLSKFCLWVWTVEIVCNTKKSDLKRSSWTSVCLHWQIINQLHVAYKKFLKALYKSFM